MVASLPAGSEPELTVDDGAEPFVRDAAVKRGEAWDPLVAVQGVWRAPSCQVSGCTLRYRFALAEAATSIDDPEIAFAHAGVYFAPPSTWLLRPVVGPPGHPFRFRVTTPTGVSFATGVSPASEPNTFQADIADLPSAPYSAFGKLALSRLPVDGGVLEIARAPGVFAVGDRAVMTWIEGSAATVSRYYGQFPVKRALLLLVPTRGGHAGIAKALGNGGASVFLPVAQDMKPAAFADDWVLVHEMLHLGFPGLSRQHIWLEEGIATYVEPIARARTGGLTAEAVWSGLVKGLPDGLPRAGDQGLDRTHTWGRTYWGGALYCLLADLDIRERSQNRRSLDDALRSILTHVGNITERFEMARVLSEGDRATGLSVMSDLYRKMSVTPYAVDLPKLWEKLGVIPKGDTVTFDDRAPLAAIRRSITAPYSVSLHLGRA